MTRGSFNGDYFKLGITIKLEQITRFIHNVIYEIVTGRKIRKGYVISHKNDDGFNNKIENLEEVTQKQNMMNMLKLGNSHNAIMVRQLFHDNTSPNVYLSLNQAAKLSDTSLGSLVKVIRGVMNGAGDCKCKLQYQWEKVTEIFDNDEFIGFD